MADFGAYSGSIDLTSHGTFGGPLFSYLQLKWAMSVAYIYLAS